MEKKPRAMMSCTHGNIVQQLCSSGPLILLECRYVVQTYRSISLGTVFQTYCIVQIVSEMSDT